MSKELDYYPQREYCRVAVIKGIQFLLLPDGRKIPGQITSTIVQGLNHVELCGTWCEATITVKAYLNDTDNDST